MSPPLSLCEHTALAYLAGGHSTATHQVSRAAGLASTAMARTMLRRLERHGLVEGQRASRFGKVCWWKITNAGRGAISVGAV